MRRARARLRRDVALAGAPRSRPAAGRRRLEVRACRCVSPRSPAPSRGHGSPPDASNARNASSSEPPYVHALDRRSLRRRPIARLPRPPPPSVHWSQACTSAIAYIGRCCPAPQRAEPPRPAEPPAGSLAPGRGELRLRAKCKPSNLSSTPPASTRASRPVSPLPRAAPRRSKQPRRPPLPGCRCAAYRPPFPTDPVPKSNPSAP
jgi:hypothetical protein